MKKGFEERVGRAECKDKGRTPSMQASDAWLSQTATIFYLRFALFLAGAFLVAMNLSELHSQLEDGCSQQSVDLVSRWMVYYRRPVCSFENMFEHIVLNAVRIIFNV